MKPEKIIETGRRKKGKDDKKKGGERDLKGRKQKDRKKKDKEIVQSRDGKRMNG